MRFRNSGFTLIELIVAMAIMAMVMTVAFAGFRVGLTAWERGTKAAERLERRSVVERLIRRQLPLAIPGLLFRGTRDRLEFFSDYSLADGPGDLRKIDYAAENGRFLYGDQPHVEYTPERPAVPPKTVLAQFNQVSFEFLGEVDKKAAWVPQWKAEDGMPPAMRIRLDDDIFVVHMVNRR
jgi:prepilin-type N-terminal cleavage/methylation domain-containing protein